MSVNPVSKSAGNVDQIEKKESKAVSRVSRSSFSYIARMTFGGVIGAGIAYVILQNKDAALEYYSRWTDDSQDRLEDENTVYSVGVITGIIASGIWSWLTSGHTESVDRTPKVPLKRSQSNLEYTKVKAPSRERPLFGGELTGGIDVDALLYQKNLYICTPTSDSLELQATELNQLEMTYLQIDGERAFDLIQLIDKALNSVDTLAFRNTAISAEKLTDFSKQYNGIAAFDLRECAVDGDLSELEKNHIVVLSDRNNILVHYNLLKEKLTNLDSPANMREFFDPTNYPVLKDETQEYPASRYFNVVKFVDCNLTNEMVEVIGQYAGVFFPNIKALNLSNNPQLTLQIFKNLETLPIVQLNVSGCPRVIYREGNIIDQIRITQVASILFKVAKNLGLRKVVLKDIVQEDSSEYTEISAALEETKRDLKEEGIRGAYLLK